MSTAAYATSKVVHAALKRRLSPWFLGNGWKKRAGHSCAFVRPGASGFWCLWIQVSSWGSRFSGSSFTLNLVQQATAEVDLSAGERVLGSLSEVDRAIGFDIAQRLAALVPMPPPSDPVYEWARQPGYQGEHWQRAIADLQKANPEAWKPGVDIWLSYYSVDDLELWVEYLLPRLQQLLRLSNDAQRQR